MRRFHSARFERNLIRACAAKQGRKWLYDYSAWGVGLITVIFFLPVIWFLPRWAERICQPPGMRVLFILDLLALVVVIICALVARQNLYGRSQVVGDAQLIRCPVSAADLVARRWRRWFVNLMLVFVVAGACVGGLEWYWLGMPALFVAYLTSSIAVGLLVFTGTTWFAIPGIRKHPGSVRDFSFLAVAPIILAFNVIKDWLPDVDPARLHAVAGCFPTGCFTNAVREFAWGWPIRWSPLLTGMGVILTAPLAFAILRRRLDFDCLVRAREPGGDGKSASGPDVPTVSRENFRLETLDPAAGHWLDRWLWRWFDGRQRAIAILAGIGRWNFTRFAGLIGIVAIGGAVALNVLGDIGPVRAGITLVILLSAVFGGIAGVARRDTLQRPPVFTAACFPIGVAEYIAVVAKTSIVRLIVGAVLGMPLYCFRADASLIAWAELMGAYICFGISLVCVGIKMDLSQCGNLCSLFRARGWIELPCLMLALFAPFGILIWLIVSGLNSLTLAVLAGYALFAVLLTGVFLASYRKSNVTYSPDARPLFAATPLVDG